MRQNPAQFPYLKQAPDFENLSLIQKVEVFEYALENTTGQDLYKVLWLKSKNSEVSFICISNYLGSVTTHLGVS